MHPDLDSLCLDVDAIVAILRAHGLPRWADVLAKSAAEIRSSDFHGVTRILHCYGGMGTLNDINIMDEDSHLFDALRSRIYQKADTIRKEEDLVASLDFNPVE